MSENISKNENGGTDVLNEFSHSILLAEVNFRKLLFLYEIQNCDVFSNIFTIEIFLNVKILKLIKIFDVYKNISPSIKKSFNIENDLKFIILNSYSWIEYFTMNFIYLNFIFSNDVNIEENLNTLENLITFYGIFKGFVQFYYVLFNKEENFFKFLDFSSKNNIFLDNFQFNIHNFGNHLQKVNSTLILQNFLLFSYYNLKNMDFRKGIVKIFEKFNEIIKISCFLTKKADLNDFYEKIQLENEKFSFELSENFEKNNNFQKLQNTLESFLKDIKIKNSNSFFIYYQILTNIQNYDFIQIINSNIDENWFFDKNLILSWIERRINFQAEPYDFKFLNRLKLIKI